MNKLAAIVVLALVALTASASPFYPAIETTDQEETAQLASHKLEAFSDFCLSSRDFIKAAVESDNPEVDAEWLSALNRPTAESLPKIKAACEPVQEHMRQLTMQLETFKSKLGGDKYSSIELEQVPCVTSGKVMQANDVCSWVNLLPYRWAGAK